MMSHGRFLRHFVTSYKIMFSLTNKFFNLSLEIDKVDESKENEDFIPIDLIPSDSVLGRLLEEFASTSILPHNMSLTELDSVKNLCENHEKSASEFNAAMDKDNCEDVNHQNDMDDNIENINVAAITNNSIDKSFTKVYDFIDF